MKKIAMQNGTKEMIHDHTRIRVEFKDGIPYVTFQDERTGELIAFKLDIESLEEVEKYPYYIEIDCFSYEELVMQCYKRYHKTMSEASEDMKKFRAGEDYLDDIEIRAVKGPFKI